MKQYISPAPWDHTEEVFLKFRLVYHGQLFASQPSKQFCPSEECPLKIQNKQINLAKHKHEIRRQFHKQLSQFWKSHPILKDFSYCESCGIDHSPSCEAAPPVMGFEGHRLVKVQDFLSKKHTIEEYQIVPLAEEEFGLLCDIKILILIAGSNRRLMQSGGDLDNRVKTLIDALKMPNRKKDFGGYDSPEEGEEPFFCLMEDDSIITSLTVETDQLLLNDESDCPNQVSAIISVDLRPSYPTSFNRAFS